MSDSTYSTKVYNKQGGDEMVVASGGQLTIEAGGKVIAGTAQIGGLTTIGAAVLSTAQIQALTTSQLTALCANNDLIIGALRGLGVIS